MKYQLAWAAILLMASPVTAAAQYVDVDQLPKVSAVYVSVSDNVKGGCLPQPNALKVEAELILRRSGIKVVDLHAAGRHRLDINTIGFADSKYRCVVSFAFELYRFETLSDKSLGLILSASTSGVLANSKSKTQQALRETVNQYTTKLANEILKARQSK